MPKGTDALVRVFDEFHGNAYLENNYKVGEIKLPIPKLNKEQPERPEIKFL